MARTWSLIAGAAIVSALNPSVAIAPPVSGQDFHLPVQSLDKTLLAIGKSTNTDILFRPQDVAGLTAPALTGHYSAIQAVRLVTAGTGLAVDPKDGSIYIRGRSDGSAASQEAATDIVVTGSRIRSVRPASPVISLDRNQIDASGYGNAGDFSRSIPQNFSGGQNPGVGSTVPVASGENIGSGSSIDLRGLGQDATLTLINGHRVASGGNRQSVDVSSIPIDAIERIEIIPDGASALYGSDAVAGVANVILRRDYQGLVTTARFGGATDGGDSQQQYDLLAGHQWASGGFILSYEFGRETAIDASQRSYTATANPGLTLYPFIKHHSAILNAHEAISDSLVLKLDAGFNAREDERAYSISTAPGGTSYDLRYRSRSFYVTPSLEWSVGGNWLLTLSGTYGVDRTHYRTLQTAAGTTSTSLAACYCNRASSVEFKADGPLFSLPAGEAKLAVGGGYRKDFFHSFRTITTVPQDIDESQSDRYGYAELNVPLVGPMQAVPLIHALTFSAAARYDSYPGIDNVLTPKLGIIYDPTPDLSIKGSWGKSFKAPTLYQRYSVQTATIYPAALVGGRAYPAGSNVILLTGGRDELKPERANTWSATLDVHPRSIPGLKVQLSWFHISYRDRVIMPISLLQQALSNSDYAAMVALAPSTGAQATALAGKASYNYSGAAYDPANIVAIVDDRNLNAARQRIEGIDISAEYSYDAGGGNHISVSASGSYLNSRQKLLPTQGFADLSGTYYNPPHVRARTGISWTSPRFSLSGFVNYIGGETDIRYVPDQHVGAMATLDLAASFRSDGLTGLFKGLEFFAAIQNATNAKPDATRTYAIYDPAYDTTNYSPVGRLISGGIRKRW